MNEKIEENNEDYSSYLLIYILVEVVGVLVTLWLITADHSGGNNGALNGLLGLMIILAMLGIRIVLTIAALTGRYFFAKRSTSPAFIAQSKTVLRVNLFITALFFLLIFSMISF